MSFGHKLRFYADLAKDLILKPAYKPHEFWQRRHSQHHDFWTVGRRKFDQRGNEEWYGRLAGNLVSALRAAHVDLERSAVLEIGCGTGYWTKLLRDSGCRNYRGIDIAPAAIEWLRPQYPDYQFTAADVSAIPLGGPWDLIVMMHVDEHIHGERFLAALRHMKDALAPHGRLLTTYKPTHIISGVPYVEYHTREDFARVFPNEWIAELPNATGGDPLLEISPLHARA